ncbi:MAG: diguanylate cyclase [Acidobacteriota bacterium]|nr:diguanylate cyclase [Acidobacteriota bacterium]
MKRPASLGVAAIPEDGSSSAAVLRAADMALYRAKREGRGKVVIAK